MEHCICEKMDSGTVLQSVLAVHPLEIHERYCASQHVTSLLGCNLGKGSHLDSNLIEDFDLVSVGDETSVEVILVTGEVLVGVLTLLPIKIGSNCTLGYDSVIEPGSILENGVELSPRSLVTKNSHLKTRSLWHGKPATLVERDDVENDSKEQRRDASLQVEESENATLSLDSSSGNAARQKRYLLCQLFTLFVLTPSFAAIELGVAVLTGRVILHNLGWIGMSVLVWVPFTASTVVFMVIAICFKKLLLGKVHSGKWLLHGSFHRRKYVVDHFIRGHLLVWQEFASLVGSPVAHSAYIRQGICEALGVQLGRDVTFRSQEVWTCYALLSLGDNNTWGGIAEPLPWSVEDGHLVGRKVEAGNNCYVGTHAIVMGGVQQVLYSNHGLPLNRRGLRC